MDFGVARWTRMLDLDHMGSDLDMLGAEAVGCLMGGAVDDAVSAGNRDENALTDLEFNARHPERLLLRDPKIQPGEKDLAKEWLSIRDTIVRPALAKARAAAPAASPGIPATSPAAAPPPGSNAAVAEQAAATKRNQIIAGVLGTIAAVGIIVAATR